MTGFRDHLAGSSGAALWTGLALGLVLSLLLAWGGGLAGNIDLTLDLKPLQGLWLLLLLPALLVALSVIVSPLSWLLRSSWQRLRR
ncbi:MAG TPA: hypothetical protein DD491_14500 [Halieaceae bacterium]|nr:hypothetical protein [Halieaceae bacterium]